MLQADALRDRDWPLAGVKNDAGDTCWVASRPLSYSFWSRVKDVWKVLTGKADAVEFRKQ